MSYCHCFNVHRPRAPPRPRAEQRPPHTSPGGAGLLSSGLGEGAWPGGHQEGCVGPRLRLSSLEHSRREPARDQEGPCAPAWRGGWPSVGARAPGHSAFLGRREEGDRELGIKKQMQGLGQGQRAGVESRGIGRWQPGAGQPGQGPPSAGTGKQSLVRPAFLQSAWPHHLSHQIGAPSSKGSAWVSRGAGGHGQRAQPDAHQPTLPLSLPPKAHPPHSPKAPLLLGVLAEGGRPAGSDVVTCTL